LSEYAILGLSGRPVNGRLWRGMAVMWLHATHASLNIIAVLPVISDCAPHATRVDAVDCTSALLTQPLEHV
jgi:hypothetical protein